jgi:hypothetical protein
MPNRCRPYAYTVAYCWELERAARKPIDVLARMATKLELLDDLLLVWARN